MTSVVPKAEIFGDLINADHKVLREGCESRNNYRYAVSWYKIWQHSGYNHTRAKQKLLRKHKGAYRSSWSRQRKPKVIYTGNSWEFGKSCEELSWKPHRSETNGIAERAVHRVKERTSLVLLQSGLDEKWRADSMECYCYLRNIQDLLSVGKTPYERRFGTPLTDQFSRLEQWSNITLFCAKDLSRVHQFGPKVLPGIFVGYVLYVGGIWKGDIFVADIEELEEMDASELHARQFHNPDCGWNSQNTWRISTSETIRLKSGTSQTEEKNKIIFEENQKGLLQPHFTTHRCVMVKQEMISGPFQGTLFTVITLNPESNCTC